MDEPQVPSALLDQIRAWTADDAESVRALLPYLQDDLRRFLEAAIQYHEAASSAGSIASSMARQNARQ